jgi:aminoimidazole riboside kinase
VPQVVVLGDACVDMNIRLPDRGANNIGHTQSPPQLHGGGTAANTAVALSRLGTNVTMITTVGDDGYGRWVKQDLENENIDTCGVHFLRDTFTPMVMAVIKPDGERMVFVWPPEGGAQNAMQKDHISPALLSGKDWLHTTGMCLRASPSRETILHGMQQARSAGLTVSIDLNMRLELWGLSPSDRKTFLQAVELADVVFGNAAEEIQPLSGESSLEAAVSKLAGDKRTIIARLGARGAWIFSPKTNCRLPAYEVPITDTLGAGDAFNSGFIAARLKGHNSQEAGHWGNAAAALKITQAGARGSAMQSELIRFLSNH